MKVGKKKSLDAKYNEKTQNSEVSINWTQKWGEGLKEGTLNKGPDLSDDRTWDLFMKKPCINLGGTVVSVKWTVDQSSIWDGVKKMAKGKGERILIKSKVWDRHWLTLLIFTTHIFQQPKTEKLNKSLIVTKFSKEKCKNYPQHAQTYSLRMNSHERESANIIRLCFKNNTTRNWFPYERTYNIQ